MTTPFRSLLSRISRNAQRIFFFSFALGTLLPSMATQTLLLEPDKRLEATISPDFLNRITVAHDRITQIFGDEGTFESQNDETTGQLFLKPTAENGLKELSLTLITEQGITQDLTLKPTAKAPTTLILQPKTLGANSGPKPTPGMSFEAQPETPSFGVGLGAFSKNSPVEEGYLGLLKQAMADQLPPDETQAFPMDPSSRPAPEGVRLTLHQAYFAFPYGVHVFRVENTTPTSLEVEEKDFYQAGDLALSLEKRVLAPDSPTLLYVVTRQGNSHA